MSMRGIYRKVAKKYGVSVGEVKREMQSAIGYAYMKSDQSESEKRIQASVICKDEIPTTDEFIRFVANKIK